MTRRFNQSQPFSVFQTVHINRPMFTIRSRYPQAADSVKCGVMAARATYSGQAQA